MSTWLKKSLYALVVATLTIPSVSVENHEYDVFAQWAFITKGVGTINYDREERKLVADIYKSHDVTVSHHMVNDSLFVETNENKNVKEKYIYKKDSLQWYLDEYVVLATYFLSNRDSEAIEEARKRIETKKSLVGMHYDKTALFATGLLEHYLTKSFVNNSQDSLGITLFGESYRAYVSGDNLIESQNDEVSSMDFTLELASFESSNKDNFIVDEPVKFTIKKTDSLSYLASADTKVKAYGLNWNVKIRPKDD